MRKFITTILVVITLLSMLLLNGCSSGSKSGAETTGSKKGDKVVYLGIVNPPVQFNPISVGDQASGLVNSIIFDTLLDQTAPLQFASKLADKFETSDNQTFTVELNPNAKWSDGQPLTAHDVAFTLNLASNPKAESSIGTYTALLEGVGDNGKLPPGQDTNPSIKVINDKQLQFRTKRPVDPNIIKEFIGTKVYIAPKHILEKIKPEELAKNPFVQAPSVTSGPFTFVKHEKSQYVEFKANPSYYRGKPKLDKLFLKVMPAANLVAQLQTGEIDMNVGQSLGLIPVQDYETVKKLPNVKTKFESALTYQTMMFNTENLSDSKVRQAIVYAIDRQKIIEKLLQGTADLVDGPYTTLNPYLDKNLKLFPYDPDKAKQLLQEAGWDGARVLNFVVPVGNKVREQSADLIVQDLEKVGVKAKITTFDFPTVMQISRVTGKFDLVLMGMPAFIDPDAENQYKKGARNNFMRYNNPESDALLAQGKTEPDSAKRHAIYNKLQKIWDQDLPFITLYCPQDLFAVSKRVKVGEAKTFGMFYNLHEWDVE